MTNIWVLVCSLKKLLDYTVHPYRRITGKSTLRLNAGGLVGNQIILRQSINLSTNQHKKLRFKTPTDMKVIFRAVESGLRR